MTLTLMSHTLLREGHFAISIVGIKGNTRGQGGQGAWSYAGNLGAILGRAVVGGGV